ncbi:MAG: phosphonate metabolism protein/1,5-bisphosphokinase (PRPP-forming) PhnN [Hyphomicrobiales bacterium]
MTKPADFGTLFAIVGPSGSGKDTVINWLRDKLHGDQNVLFVRRVITRVADVRHEDHDTMSLEAFDLAERNGAFAVTWGAHDLRYGIPTNVKDHLQKGHVGIVNGSRRALDDMHSSFENLQVICLRVDPEILSARLRARDRKSDTDIKTRIAQAQLPLGSNLNVIEIDNMGPVAIAGTAILEVINSAM